jgi:hypothetical protein
LSIKKERPPAFPFGDRHKEEKVNINRVAPDNDFGKWRDWYVITIAKTYNAALEVYAWGLYRVEVADIRKFSEDVNNSYTAKSLYPKAPVGSVPMRYFYIKRDTDIVQYMDDFRRHMKELLDINRTQIHARKILVDFHKDADPVGSSYLDAAETVLKELLAEDEVDEVALMK